MGRSVGGEGGHQEAESPPHAKISTAAGSEVGWQDGRSLQAGRTTCAVDKALIVHYKCTIIGSTKDDAKRKKEAEKEKTRIIIKDANRKRNVSAHPIANHMLT